MKCPKCDYLGFETGDRCRNCGYDFSLLALAEPDADLPLAAEPPAPSSPFESVPLLRPLGEPSPAVEDFDLPLVPVRDAAAANPDAAVAGAGSGAAPRLRATPSRPGRPGSGLPLFSGDSPSALEPLVQLPVVPRAPIAVRRAPEFPRFTSTVPPLVPPAAKEEDDQTAPEPPRRAIAAPSRPIAVPPSRQRTPVAAVPQETCAPAQRARAALIDAAILLLIDLVVVYLTLRMAGLPFAEWRALPPLPLLAFVSLLAFGYHAALTALGGQTIGKMAVGIRVVADDQPAMRPAWVFTRTLAGAVSVVTLGLTYLPALLGSDGRALHDRLANTRVVSISAA